MNVRDIRQPQFFQDSPFVLGQHGQENGCKYLSDQITTSYVDVYKTVDRHVSVALWVICSWSSVCVTHASPPAGDPWMRWLTLVSASTHKKPETKSSFSFSPIPQTVNHAGGSGLGMPSRPSCSPDYPYAVGPLKAIGTRSSPQKILWKVLCSMWKNVEFDVRKISFAKGARPYIPTLSTLFSRDLYRNVPQWTWYFVYGMFPVGVFIWFTNSFPLTGRSWYHHYQKSPRFYLRRWPAFCLLANTRWEWDECNEWNDFCEVYFVTKAGCSLDSIINFPVTTT